MKVPQETHEIKTQDKVPSTRALWSCDCWNIVSQLILLIVLQLITKCPNWKSHVLLS